MRSTKAKERWETGALAVVLLTVFYILLLVANSTLQVYAQTAGKVTSVTANIRQEADASSTAIASVMKDDTISIKAKTTGSDGNVWYQIYVDANTLGFIRSDLVSVSGEVTSTVASTGSSTDNATTGSTNTPPPEDNVTAEIKELNPISATVTGKSVRVRKNCTTNSSIVTTVANGVAVTAKGQATGTEGKLWYQVSFISDGAEVTGFIRSDFLTLSGEAIPVSEILPEDTTPDETVPEEVVPETKDYDVSNVEGKWYLLDNINSKQYELPRLLEVSEQNAVALDASLSKVDKQGKVISILVIVVILLVMVVAFGVWKFKEELFGGWLGAKDDMVIRRRPTEQRRPGQRPSGNGQTRPAGQRPSGNGQARPAGQRQTRLAGQRPSGSGQTRPAGQRPSGSSQTRPAVQHPAGSGQTRPAGQRPSGSGQTRPAGQRPTGTAQTRSVSHGPSMDAMTPAYDMTESTETDKIRLETERSLVEQQMQRKTRPVSTENTERKSKNFLTDDEEFEFEFLNWNGEEEV